jgi:hypothetical protein
VANLTNQALNALYLLLSGEAGLKISLENLAEAQGREVQDAKFQLERRLWSAKWSEREGETRLPRVAFSLKQLSSRGAEKLARSSAKATLLVEIAISAEKAEQVQNAVADYIDALLDVLERNRGLWSAGVFYAGEFDVEIKPLAKGGLNFTQSAVFEIEVYLWQE